ncbi:MAG: 2-hydroxyacyl-CoA dehydratase subunit D [Chloroflexota bacterium]
MAEKVAGRGLATANKYYQDYGGRARELKKQGQRIMGYLCALAPVEIISAAGFVPFRIKGDVNEPITKADSEMETIVCPLVRSCFDMSLKGKYEFLDGIIIPHACDSIARSYSTISYSLGLPYSHFVNIPHTTKDISREFFTAELGTFKESLARFAGKEISDGSLAEAIQLNNSVKAKVRELYQFRKSDPPLISGTEVTKVLVAAMGIPPVEASQLLDDVIDEVKNRTSPPVKKLPRIMVVGAEVDDIAFIKLIEDNGANVVIDSMCVGTRDYFFAIDTGQDPLGSIADYYLRKLNCPRTYREWTGQTYEEDLEARFGDIGSFVKDFKVDGVILYILKYCDPFGFEVPARMQYIQSLDTPVLYIEDEYSMSTIARLRTRVQAFLEILAR